MAEFASLDFTHPIIVSRLLANLLVRVVVFCCLCAPAAGVTFHVDDFQSGALPQDVLGWSGGSAPRRVPSGGPTGDDDAFLEISSGGSNLATYNNRSDWVGDYSALGAATVSVDLMATSPTVDPLPMRLVLFGPDFTDNRWTSSSPAMVPSDGAWRHYEFSMAAEDLTRVQGMAAYEQMFADVVQVMLRYDPGSASPIGMPVSATVGIDNIRLSGQDVPPVVGDYDGNGSVGPEDYDVWVGTYAVSVEPPGTGADGNGDGIVGTADYTVWRDNVPAATFGKALSPIPEPSTLLMAGLAVIAVLLKINVTQRP